MLFKILSKGCITNHFHGYMALFWKSDLMQIDGTLELCKTKSDLNIIELTDRNLRVTEGVKFSFFPTTWPFIITGFGQVKDINESTLRSHFSTTPGM